MPLVTVTCSHCNAKLRVADQNLGKKCRCPKCSEIFLLPPPAMPPDEPALVPALIPAPSPAADPPPPSPPPELTRKERFLLDLRTVGSSLSLRNPVADLAILAARFNERRQSAAARARRFAADLREVYATTTPPDLDARLPELASVLSRRRAEVQSRARASFEQLPDDDPLRCPISLFGVMDRGRLETAHTNVLAWLLDPRREHGFGAALLTPLLARLDPSRPAGSVLVDRCDSEFSIDDGCRLDVLIEGTTLGAEADGASWSWMLMVEAKIDASESLRQLKKYDKWASKKAQGREVLRLFLTAEGRKAETAAEDWTPLSFLDLACLFREHGPSLAHAPGSHFLRYYIAGVLKDIYRWNLPIGDPQFLDDPYNFLEYLTAVSTSETRP